MMSGTLIETPRLVLRRLKAPDAGAIADQIADRDVVRMLARAPHPYRLEDARAYLEKATGFPWEFAITCRGDDRLIGVVGITGHLGYWLGRKHWGQGYMTEAATGLLEVWFAKKSSAKVISGVFADNPGSKAVLDKLGFVQTGTSRQFCPARGAEVDHIDMELCRTRWQERRAA